jgi:hypothetical protein
MQITKYFHEALLQQIFRPGPVIRISQTQPEHRHFVPFVHRLLLLPFASQAASHQMMFVVMLQKCQWFWNRIHRIGAIYEKRVAPPIPIKKRRSLSENAAFTFQYPTFTGLK